MAEDNTNSWANVTQSPEIVMKLMLLQKREGFIQALMGIKKADMNGAKADASRTAVWLAAMFAETCAILKRDDKKLFDDINDAINTNDINLHMTMFVRLSEYLDNKGLTKWDTRKTYDYTKLDQVLENVRK